MTSPPDFSLDASVVRLSGQDAVRIANNLTTADLAKLDLGDCTESFVTDVRGKTLGHVFVRREEFGLMLVGSPSQSDAIANHVDKYTIREDCEADVVDKQFTADLYSPSRTDFSGQQAWTVAWLGVDTTMVLRQNDVDKADQSAVDRPAVDRPAVDPHKIRDFHDSRIHSGFPWWGIDFGDTNLPQEINRDARAISFTKGCYLGQETVARLDALGQVQKKLVRLAIQDGQVRVGDKLTLEGKPVAKITSLTSDSTLAMAMVRRVWFDPGTDANGTCDRTGETVTSTVIG